MRSFSDEFRAGTFEILRTKPLSTGQLVMGKFMGSFLVVLIALLPTSLYAITIDRLAVDGGIDVGGTIGSYIGLVFLSAVFIAISICCSSLTNNAVIAFISSAFVCFIAYSGFNAISQIPALKSGADYYIEMLGIDFHYNSVSRGVIDSRDIIYFCSIILFFLLFTNRNVAKR